MSRRVLVYRAEAGAQNAFGSQAATATPPEERVPLEVFEVGEAEPDAARESARRHVAKRFGERPESVQILTDGSISVTLRAPSR